MFDFWVIYANFSVMQNWTNPNAFFITSAGVPHSATFSVNAEKFCFDCAEKEPFHNFIWSSRVIFKHLTGIAPTSDQFLKSWSFLNEYLDAIFVF